MEKPIFNRPVLAEQFAKRVIHVAPTSAISSGMFVAAPRRTGKTTFMRQDLTPRLTEIGALVIYVDLWTDKSANPSDLIVGAIRMELGKHRNALVKLASRFGIGGGKVAGVEFSLDRVGMGKDVSLVGALAALSDATEQTIVLIIDEAQHAISTQEGSDAMFALKAARDELNSSGHFGLRIICTGSNRDKLAMLRNSKDQAFFGAPIVSFPPLGKDYVQWFCDITTDLPAMLDPVHVATLFARAGSRPEILNASADALRMNFELQEEDVAAEFAREVDEQVKISNSEAMRVVHSLTPLQRAILLVMAAGGERYAPFESTTMERYNAAASNAGEKGFSADVPGVQQALVALQERGLIWKAARGVYAIEDSALTAQLDEAGLLAGLYD